MSLGIPVLKIWSVVLFSFLFLTSNRTYQTSCVSMQSDGYITINIWDTKKGSRYRAEEARKDAIHALLYSGISGGQGCNTQTALLRDIKSQENFKKIAGRFFARNGNWTVYTRSAELETTLPLHLGDESWRVYSVSVSKNGLRKFLEDNNIIKTLNNGF